MANSGHVGTLQAGEGSVAAEERTNEVPKMCENNNGFLEDEVSQKKDDVEKASGNDGSFYDCNICLDLATDPVVTCCGHLFCWPCLYQWLHVHSDAKECPVCKGEVTVKNDLSPPQDSNGSRGAADRTHSILNRIMTYRGMRAEQNPIAPPDEMVDLTQTRPTGTETGPTRRANGLLLRRSQAQSLRSSTHTAFSSALNSTERIAETYFRNHPTGRNQEQPQPVDDRDSFSSVAAVINSGSQMDTAVESDSMVSLSTSSSRRRNDASRISDVDSGDSRAPRRRRLN
ncbi:hypothetical protein NC652_017186 [Populus alba x Populus x berolinensis]|nr:hypothetical protein NC652_017186 [Populus alba x Populus x berolinensis]